MQALCQRVMRFEESFRTYLPHIHKPRDLWQKSASQTDVLTRLQSGNVFFAISTCHTTQLDKIVKSSHLRESSDRMNNSGNSECPGCVEFSVVILISHLSTAFRSRIQRDSRAGMCFANGEIG